MEALERVRRNSEGGSEDCWDLDVWRVVCVESGVVGETTSSRHWGPWDCLFASALGESLCCPVGVSIVSSVAFDSGTSWKA